MDESIDRLRAATVLVETHGALAPTPWAYTQRGDLIDGIIAVLEDDDGRILSFVPYGGQAVSLDVTNIKSVLKRGSGFNIIIDLEFAEHNNEQVVICLVGPRKRIKRLCVAVGYPI